MKRKLDFKRSDIIAIILYLLGIKPGYTISVADSIEYGYGKLHDFGFWQFTLNFKKDII